MTARPDRRAVVAVALAALCLLAGCNGFAGPAGTPTATPDGGTATSPPAGSGASPSASPTGTAAPGTEPGSAPGEDRLGREAGYAATDPLSVNASDGLNASEREAVVARTMARVELIRGLEFTEPVPVEVVSREEFRSRDVRFAERRDPRVTEQFWEALFLVGEDANATAAVAEVFGGGVVGYYVEGRIVLVSDDDSPRVDTGTLAHELVHALQDQHFDPDYATDTFDARVGTQGLTEGDPVYVERAYRARCAGEWSCLPAPRTRPTGDAIARHPGVYLVFVQPYTTGPGFVGALRNRSGGNWTAVNEAYADPPRTSEQVIHPERYPDDRPANATVPDRSGSNWTRIGRQTAGEAGVHVAFWANGFVERRDDAVGTDYRHPLSAGWEGDALVAYADRRGPAGSADGEGAYVWRTVWTNGTEAREFKRGYETLLRLRQGAVRTGDGTYLVDSGPYADAFRVRRSGDTVTVVNAPTVEALVEVHSP